MGGKQQSYWTAHYKYLSLSSHMWCSIELLDHPVVIKNNMVSPPALNTCTGRTWGVMGSETILPLHSFITRCWQTRTQCDQIDQLDQPIFDQLLTNFWPTLDSRPAFHQLDQLPTNFSPTWPAPDQIHQLHQFFTNLTKFTNFSQTWPNRPIFHQLENLSPVFCQIDQLVTNFWHFSIFQQCFTNLTNLWPFLNQRFTKCSPTFDQQLQTFFTNLTHFRPTWPTLDQLLTNLTWQQTTNCEAEWVE